MVKRCLKSKGPEKKSQNSTANTQLEKALALVTSTDVPNCISQENLFRLWGPERVSEYTPSRISADG